MSAYVNASHDYEDYFDSTRIDVRSFTPHFSEIQGPSPDIPHAAVLQFIRISAVGNSVDSENKSHSIYYIEVRCKSLASSAPSSSSSSSSSFSSSLTPSWYVYRRYSQFRKLSDALRSGGYYVPVLPAKQPSSIESKIDTIRKRKYDLESWIKSLSDQTLFHSAAKDPQGNPVYRQFLTENANCPPVPLVRIFPENMSLRASTESSRQDTSVQPYVKVNIQDFELIRVIGKGSFGKVTLVKKKSDQKLFAMKVLNKSNVIKRKQVEHTNTERRVLGTINHPFIVKLYFAFQTEEKLHFVLDYCGGGELFFHLSRLKKFPEPMTRFYVAEITLALETLHDHNIIYRDLKPENILLDAEGHIKLADFGLAKENISDPVEGAQSLCGTPEYLSPEVLNRQGHGIAVDWWNLGMVTYEMLTGLPPWYTTDREKLFDRLRNAPLKFPFYVSRPAASLVSKLLNRNPTERLGSLGSWQVIQHPFFGTLDWDALYNREIPPPLDPCRNTSEVDTENFEKEFTNMALYSIDEGKGSTVKPSQPSKGSAHSGNEDVGNDDTFLNFTFEEQSAFDNETNQRRKK